MEEDIGGDGRSVEWKTYTHNKNQNYVPASPPFRSAQQSSTPINLQGLNWQQKELIAKTSSYSRMGWE